MFMSMLLLLPTHTPEPAEPPGTPELQNNTVTMGGFWVLELSFQTEDSVWLTDVFFMVENQDGHFCWEQNNLQNNLFC
jgi:hypothetical protein